MFNNELDLRYIPSHSCLCFCLKDVGVPSYMVDERSAVPLAIGEQLPSTSGTPEVELMMDDALPSLPSVDEKALVLYKPSDTPLTLNLGQSNVSLLVSPDLIESLKSKFY